MLAQMPADRTEIMTVATPCACGATVHVDPLHGARCESCGELISAEQLEEPSLSSVSWSAADPNGWIARSVNEPDALIGGRLGHFRIMSRLGRGGMGAVYRAMDESLQRYVALKVITERQEHDDSHVARLLAEARAQARVNHPHVVHIYYVSRNETTPFLAMELVHGPTLADRLREGPLPFREVIEIAIQIVQALQQAALFDIVHGDIKPGNILLADGDTVKLSDFGLAQRLSEMEESPARLAGTPNYLSPEACRGEATDIRSDMYALGVMLFEMTFGRLPYTFEREGAAARIKAHCTAPVEFPDSWPAHIPEAWRSVLARLLTKDPRQRYWSYDLLLDDLHELRPVALPLAGRLLRGLAWVVDVVSASALQRFTMDQFAESNMAQSLPDPVIALSGLVVPLLVTWLQARWRTSPGKELLQIRVVDVHGLTPQPSRLALRSIVSLLLLWQFALNACCEALGVPVIGRLLGAAVLLLLSADAACLLFHRDRRSIHDLLLGTQVVLGTGPRKKKTAIPRA
jgi:serine/threonine protein kinase